MSVRGPHLFVAAVPGMREFRAEFPAEPSIGSVVLDWEDMAWQRVKLVGWVRVGRAPVSGVGSSWRGLLLSGTVRLVYEPGLS